MKRIYKHKSIREKYQNCFLNPIQNKQRKVSVSQLILLKHFNTFNDLFYNMVDIINVIIV